MAMFVGPRIDLMIARADLGECDLVAQKKKQGFLYQRDGTFARDSIYKRQISDAVLRRKAKRHNNITYTCTPSGAGIRIALDRDEDGALNGDERWAGTDPADPDSIPFNKMLFNMSTWWTFYGLNLFLYHIKSSGIL